MLLGYTVIGAQKCAPSYCHMQIQELPLKHIDEDTFL